MGSLLSTSGYARPPRRAEGCSGLMKIGTAVTKKKILAKITPVE
jgi:hypothetical protein